MKILTTPIPGVLVIAPRVLHDARGAFHESFHLDRYRDAGIIGPFVQDNLSTSHRGVVRGLHFQKPDKQGKLVAVAFGVLFDVVADVRLGSPTFGTWFGCELSHDSAEQIYLPPGCAHGFQALSDVVVLSYKCDAYYSAATEHAIRWDDPDLGIAWPVAQPSLSERDRAAESLSALRDRGELPEFRP